MMEPAQHRHRGDPLPGGREVQRAQELLAAPVFGRRHEMLT
jgi:hypothetical protein